jgi:hypothetical protein
MSTVAFRAALRRHEATSGDLMIYRIAGKDFTTLSNIEEMKASWRVEAKALVFRSTKPKAAPRSGPSATDSEPSAQVALRESVKKLREGLASTSPKNTIREPASAAVIRMPSR